MHMCDIQAIAIEERALSYYYRYDLY